jgi:hypothetical protein
VLSVLESIVEYGSYASRRGWGQARSWASGASETLIIIIIINTVILKL